MKYDEKELLLIWIDSFREIDYKTKYAIYELLAGKTDIKKNIQSNCDLICKSIGESGYNILLSSANKDYLNATLKELSESGERAVTLASEDYPERLKEIPEPPLVLYAKGNLELLRGKLFGVVGSRRSLPLSLSIAKDFSTEFTESGLTLVTGTAEGVDSEVLKAGLKKNAVIAVSAGGLNNIYPAMNAGLIEEVAKHGLVISEHREDVKAMPYMFPVRNRIIAGLSDGVLIVNGRIKSGTAYTAEYCHDYNRDLFVVPYSVGIESGRGNNELLKRGAILADCPEDVLSFYGLEKKEKEKEILFSDTERKIMDSLKDGSLHIEKIAERTNLQVYEITSALTVLEIKGIIYKNGTNTYGLIRNREN